MCHNSATADISTQVLTLRRAFFEAGMAWKAAGRSSMAFVILNRFLDMADAQEDPAVHSLADLENADFVNTGGWVVRAETAGSKSTGTAVPVRHVQVQCAH